MISRFRFNISIYETLKYLFYIPIFSKKNLENDLKNKLSKYYEKSDFYFYDHGRTALYEILREIKKYTKRKKILINSLTLFEIVNVIIYAGFEPEFVDNKSCSFETQIDLNTYWLSTLNFVAEVFDNEDWKNIVKNNFQLIKKLTTDKVFHCYKDKVGVNVFLEDYTYLSKLMINLYETTGELIFLDDAKKTMTKTWDLFYDKNNKILQKNPVNENDLFVSPADLNDHNIPNGNSIFLINSKKLEAITGEETWKNMVKELKQSFHSFLNLNSSQMISYIKNLDMCEELTTFTFFGNFEKNKDIHDYVKKKYLRSSVLIYKKSSAENYLIVCKNQTCSNKIKSLEELKLIEKNYAV